MTLERVVLSLLKSAHEKDSNLQTAVIHPWLEIDSLYSLCWCTPLGGCNHSGTSQPAQGNGCLPRNVRDYEDVFRGGETSECMLFPQRIWSKLRLHTMSFAVVFCVQSFAFLFYEGGGACKCKLFPERRGL